VPKDLIKYVKSFIYFSSVQPILQASSSASSFASSSSSSLLDHELVLVPGNIVKYVKSFLLSKLSEDQTLTEVASSSSYKAVPSLQAPPLPPPPPPAELLSKLQSQPPVLNIIKEAILTGIKENVVLPRKLSVKKSHNVCIDWLNRNCTNNQCDELHKIPYDFKTLICSYWSNTRCKFTDQECRYAHGYKDPYHNLPISQESRNSYHSNDRVLYNTSRSRSRSRERRGEYNMNIYRDSHKEEIRGRGQTIYYYDYNGKQ
jgi:hypothetical protein